MDSAQHAIKSSSQPHGVGRRRWMLPVVFALLAAALWWWGYAREVQATAEVAAFVQDLIAGDPSVRERAWSRLNDDFLARELKARLGALSSPLDAQTQERLSIQVWSGDPTPQSVGSATHAAAVLRGPRKMLTLRVAHPGRPGEIQVIGFIDHSVADHAR